MSDPHPVPAASPSLPAPWPHERGSHAGVLLQFGGARADLIGEALTTGDPLADAVVHATHEHGAGIRAQLDQGVRRGLASLEDPHPAVRDLLASTEALPVPAGDPILEEGSRPFFTMPSPAHIVSLSAGALIRVYQSPSIASVLATTGRLIDGADRRIRETGRWVSTTMLPGSLRPGQEGYVGTVQVRMLHAHMRHLARTRGYDEAAYGAPINQVDLARTWMDFTVTSFRAEEEMGFGLTTAETASLYRYWGVVAHVLGVDPRLVEGIRSNDQAARVDEMLQAVTGPLIPEASRLAEATLGSISTLLHEALNVPESLGTAGLHSLARRFHGRQLADEMGLRDNRAAHTAIDVAITRVRARRQSLRSDPAVWENEIAKNVRAVRAQVAEDTRPLYATHATTGA